VISLNKIIFSVIIIIIKCELLFTMKKLKFKKLY